MILSICVISHNQREVLKRCLDSLLAQSMPFDNEILVSDDASSDGSYELAIQYQNEFPQIQAFQCNTNDFNPTTKSSRSGWNRCNAVQHATGKYVAFVDGDDFFYPGKNIYKEQIELLEQHPECSGCMANDYSLQDGMEYKYAEIRHPEVYETGRVITAAYYLQNTFRESHCFVYRRRDIDYMKTIGGAFVDSCLTAFFIQFGDIVCLNDAGCIYVQYKSSIWHDYKKTNDYIVLGTPALYNTKLYPMWKPVYWQSITGLRQIKGVVNAARDELPMTDATIRWMANYDYYIYHVFNRRLTLLDKIHLWILWILLTIMIRIKRRHPRVSMPWRLLDKLL